MNNKMMNPRPNKYNDFRRSRKIVIYKGFPDQCVPVETEDNGRIPRPHYSDNNYKNVQLLYLKGGDQSHLLNGMVEWVYSDRVYQWDREKAEKANAIALKGTSYPSVRYMTAFIREFYDNKYECVAVAGGVNHSNGYEYFVFGMKKNQ